MSFRFFPARQAARIKPHPATQAASYGAERVGDHSWVSVVAELCGLCLVAASGVLNCILQLRQHYSRVACLRLSASIKQAADVHTHTHTHRPPLWRRQPVFTERPNSHVAANKMLRTMSA